MNDGPALWALRQAFFALFPKWSSLLPSTPPACGHLQPHHTSQHHNIHRSSLFALFPTLGNDQRLYRHRDTRPYALFTLSVALPSPPVPHRQAPSPTSPAAAKHHPSVCFLTMATLNWRTINIDALDPDSPANFDLSSLSPAVQPVSTADVQSLAGQIRQLLRGGDSEGALQGALENPPYGGDEKAKVRTARPPLITNMIPIHLPPNPTEDDPVSSPHVHVYTHLYSCTKLSMNSSI